MRFAFLQKDAFIQLGIETLAGVLHDGGHRVEVFIDDAERDLAGAVLASRPDAIAFSCVTGYDEWVEEVANRIKAVRPELPVIVGGPHPTYFPDFVRRPGIDYICQGEGEGAILDFANALQQRDAAMLLQIPNIWAKRDGEIYQNAPRRFIADLDTIPREDWTIYAKYPFLVPYFRNNYPIMTSRGCPLRCSFCFNEKYSQLYEDKGEYLRRRTVRSMVDHLRWLVEERGVRRFSFIDDDFIRVKWLREFAPLYAAEVRVPCTCNVRASTVNDEAAALLKQMNCYCVRMGIESGNDEIRRKVLFKNVSNQRIIDAGRAVKKYKMDLLTYNIFGIPGESVEKALETYQINKDCGADFAQSSILTPYPGLSINEYIEQMGALDPNHLDPMSGLTRVDKTYFIDSKLKLEGKNQILNLQKLMQFFLAFHVPMRVIRWLIRFPENKLYTFIFRATYGYFRLKVNRRELIPLFRLAFRTNSYISMRPRKKELDIGGHAGEGKRLVT